MILRLPRERHRQSAASLAFLLLLILLFLAGCSGEDRPEVPQPQSQSSSAQEPTKPQEPLQAAITTPPIGFCPPLPRAQNLGSLPAEDSQNHAMEKGSAHLFEIELEAGEYTQLEVDQRGLDVFVALLDHRGRELLASDNLTGKHGLESLPWWSAQPQQVQLLICAPEAGDVQGTYHLTRSPTRRAEAPDHARVAAAKAYHEGLRLLTDPAVATARQAATSFQEALALWDESGDPLGMVHSLYYLGIIARKSPRTHHQALDRFENALRFATAGDSPQLTAAILYEMGSLHQTSGALEQAAALFARALPLLGESGVLPLEATVANELGFVLVRSGQAARALPHYQHALKLWRSLEKEVQEAQVLHNLGRGYFQLGNQQQAHHYLEQALAIRRRFDLKHEQASTLTALGGVYSKSRDHSQAISALRQALELRNHNPKRRGRASTLITLGVALRRGGLPQEALESYEEALAILRQEGDVRQEALVLNDLGWLHESLAHVDEAVDYFRQALPLFEKAADPRWETMTHSGLAFAERRRGNLLVAKAHIEKALERAELLRFLPASTSLQHTVFASMQSFYDFHIDLLMELEEKLPQTGYATQALAASEHARARSLLDALVESDRQSSPLAAPQLQRRKLRLEREIQQRGNLRRRLLEESPDGPQRAAAEKALRELFAEYDALHEMIRMESPRYASFAETRVVAPEVIQHELLDEDTLLLEYKLGVDRSFVWAMTEDHIRSFHLPPKSEIEEIARQVYQLLSRGGRRQVKTEIELAKLSETILGPVADFLDRRRLLVVSDGALEYIPFTALPMPGAKPGEKAQPPLLVHHEIISLPSASVATVLRRQRLGRQPPPALVAVLADPVFQADDPRVQVDSPPSSTASLGADRRRSASPRERKFERLIYSSQEADAVLEQVADGQGFLASGFAANRATALSPDLDQYRILHFATHGDLDTEHPELSRLVLSLVNEQGQPQEGFLYAHEIYDLNLPADLVVLSACQTALGKEIRGEGLVGLTQGFLYAGANRVLVSLWNIDDQATAQLMAHFYRQLLRQGLSPAAALRSAQLEIRQQAGWSSPFFWAGFILQGEWQ